MTSTRVVRLGTAVALLATTTSCARAGNAAPAEPSSVPVDGVVLEVRVVGEEPVLAAQLPAVVVFDDGRVFTQTPVLTIAPGAALPGLQVQRIDHSAIDALVERALTAGADADRDVGAPAAGTPWFRFTVSTGAGPVVRYVQTGTGDLTPEQQAGQAGLLGLLDELVSLDPAEAGSPQGYRPEAVAAVATPWADLPDRPAHADARWVGPALPGEPFGEGFGCVTATGDEAQAVLDAARSATAATPWVTPDGARWAVAFRPLLPHEDGCADLLLE